MQKSCSCCPWESVLYILLYAIQCSYVAVCYMRVLWAKIPLQCCCFGFKYALPVRFVLCWVLKGVFFCVLWHLCGYITMQMCPSAFFQHSDVSLLSPFCFLPWLQRGIFVNLCAGFELVCLVGRVMWKFCEWIIISGCCSKFWVHQKRVCEQPKTSHSYPTSTSQCRCSSPACAQQGAGHQPQSRPVNLISVRHDRHTRG